MARWVSAWLVLGLLGLLAARGLVSPLRDTWMVVTAGRDGSMLVAEYTVSNTGVFADQLTTRVTLLRRSASPLAHRAVSGPATIDDDGVHGALDGVERGDDGWTWRVEGASMRVRGSARGAIAGCPGTPARAAGILDLPDAAFGQGEGASLDGPALFVRVTAHRNESGSALYALDNRGALALDPRGACPGLLVLDGAGVTGSPPWIPPDPEDNFGLDFGGHHVEVQAGRHEYVDSPADNTLWGERILAWAAGYRLPQTVLRRARVTVDGSAPWTGVLILRSAPLPWAP